MAVGLSSRMQKSMRYGRAGLLAGVGLVLVAAGQGADAQTAPAAHGREDLRNARYCEIIPVVRDGLHLVATVYNTLGLNDCPASVWNGITEDAMKKRFGALKVMLNGPRYFLMDSIVAEGATAAGETIDAGGLALTKRATITLGLTEFRTEPYRERTIKRETRYVFKAGRPAFVLEAPDGSRYVMQAYAQIVDKTLSYADLPKLGSRLKLPKGWRYTETVPDKDMILGAQGEATVVQDDLDNTYQKLR